VEKFTAAFSSKAASSASLLPTSISPCARLGDSGRAHGESGGKITVLQRVQGPDPTPANAESLRRPEMLKGATDKTKHQDK